LSTAKPIGGREVCTPHDGFRKKLNPSYALRLFRPRHTLHLPRASQGEKTLMHGIKQTRRQEPIGDRREVAARNRAQVGSGPEEFVAFAQHDPRALGIEAEAFLVANGNSMALEGSVGNACVIGSTVTRVPPSSSVSARTIAQGRSFRPFFAPFAIFTKPEIGVADDQARLGARPCHGFQSFSSASRAS
jgi:hypothetical protein